MAVSVPLDLNVPEDVLAEVKHRSADAEFQSFRSTVAEHFSDAPRIEVYLLEDPDEDDRSWVVFQVTLPATSDLDEVQRKKKNFYEDLFQRRPQIAWPICSLGIRFAEVTP